MTAPGLKYGGQTMDEDTELLRFLYEVIQDAIAETEENELTTLALDRKLSRARDALEKALGVGAEES